MLALFKAEKISQGIPPALLFTSPAQFCVCITCIFISSQLLIPYIDRSIYIQHIHISYIIYVIHTYMGVSKCTRCCKSIMAMNWRASCIRARTIHTYCTDPDTPICWDLKPIFFYIHIHTHTHTHKHTHTYIHK